MRLVALILGCLVFAQTASAFECAGVKLPSSIVICSDPELMRLADERQQAFNEARWGKSGTDLLDPEHDKELWENQKAWVRSYATECGVPPDGPTPRSPIPGQIRECFKRAAEARIAFLRTYGERARQPGARPTVSRGIEKIGPGFDCANATQPLAMMICADADLARTDLRFNQAYWALFQQLDEAGRRRLKQEDVALLENVQQSCDVHSGGLTPAPSHSRDCVKAAFETERAVWVGRISGPAYEEAVRPLDQHIILQRKLRQLALLTSPPVPEGVYDGPTRRAIISWQKAHARFPSGLLGDTDAMALQREGVAAPEPPVKQVTRREDYPEPNVAPSSPPSTSKSSSQSLGTAFAINNAGDFLTNYHVVKDCSVVRVRLMSGNDEGRVTARDERNDLAVVHLQGSSIEPMRFREGKGIRPADGVVALGFPYSGLLSSTVQVTPGAVSALAGILNDARYLQFTAPVQPGNSGGPLFDLSGNVVGVVSGRINDLAVAEATGSLPQNINFAIKSGLAREFLDANGKAYLTASSDTKFDAADIAEKATKSTVLVACSK